MEQRELILLTVINAWKKIIETKLIPVIKKTIENTDEWLEGNIYNYKPDMIYEEGYYAKQQNIILCAANPNIKKVLEIGFNSGFSTLLMLLSNPNIYVTCVDINIHPYTVPCYNIIKQYFGDRINLLIGDSTVVVPTIKDTFDLIHIDGAHHPLIAERDIVNSIRLCNNNCVLIMDDTDMFELNTLWNHYIFTYNLTDYPYDLVDTFKHSIKQYVKT
uniref:Methyltransferase n=1 Tax=viral metagenome TaxID=1070528 RepID=A0A6C0IA90_9ZZZZ